MPFFSVLMGNNCSKISLDSARPTKIVPKINLRLSSLRTVFYDADLSLGCMHIRSVRVAERLALPTSDHGVTGSNPTGGEILPEPKQRFIAQSLSCSPFHRLKMTEILSKGRKTLTHPSIVCT